MSFSDLSGHGNELHCSIISQEERPDITVTEAAPLDRHREDRRRCPGHSKTLSRVQKR